MYKIGQQVIYNLTEEESAKCNNSRKAPAIIVAIWPNEFPNNEDSTGLNLKVITDGNSNIWKTSVEKGNGIGQFEEGPFCDTSH